MAIFLEFICFRRRYCNFPSLIIQDSALFAPIVTVFTPDLSELGLATFTGMMI
jgi:hypothetical protein